MQGLRRQCRPSSAGVSIELARSRGSAGAVGQDDMAPFDHRNGNGNVSTPSLRGLRAQSCAPACLQWRPASRSSRCVCICAGAQMKSPWHGRSARTRSTTSGRQASRPRHRGCARRQSTKRRAVTCRSREVGCPAWPPGPGSSMKPPRALISRTAPLRMRSVPGQRLHSASETDDVGVMFL